MDLQLKGKTGLVTGAGIGLGESIAKVLAKEGVRLAITARRRELLEKVADEIGRDTGSRPLIFVGDLATREGPAQLARSALEAFGHVDILVNNAGGSRPLTLETGKAVEAVWEESFALNFNAARRLTEAMLPAMRAQKWGRVINITGSMEPRNLNAASPAKAALHLWAKGLSCLVAADGITINCIPPGRIKSEQILKRLHPTEESRRKFVEENIPIGYLGEPEDLAHLVAFLASPLARYLTGLVIPVDGGMHYFAH